MLVDDWDTLRGELGGGARVVDDDMGRRHIVDSQVFTPLEDVQVRQRAFAWLADRVNVFVNVLRPRVRSAVADYPVRGESA